MSQTYMIALDPSLDLSSEQFANAWNENSNTQQTGQLSQPKGIPATFADPNFIVLLLETAVVVASGVLISQINALINDRLRIKAKAQEILQPDGSKIIIIVKEK